jgi:hypothetical protein
MEKRKPEDWYDYHQAEWETIAVISNLEKKCYIINVINGSSDHVVEQIIKGKGFNLGEIDWYRTTNK